MSENPFVGKWTYRSLLNDPDVNTGFDMVEFGRGTIIIEQGSMDLLTGSIGGPGWSLALHGSRAYVSPMRVRFQGAIVGSVTRAIPHPSNGGTAPAGVVESFHAARAD